MGLFRSKSNQSNYQHGIPQASGAQTLTDLEGGPTSQSAPEWVQPYQPYSQQRFQQQDVLVVDRSADRSAANNRSSSSTNPQWQPAVPNNLGTAISTSQVVYAQHPPTAAPAAAAAAAVTAAELTPAQRRTLQHLQHLTKVMDTAVTIPGIKVKVGLDGLIGLIPVVGDAAGTAVGGYIISRALKYNLPKRLVLRMLINQAIDSCIGIIPLVGDLFDIGFKANTRNMRLLQDHLEHPKAAKKADCCFLCSFFVIVVVVPLVVTALVVMAIVLGVLAGLGKL